MSTYCNVQLALFGATLCYIRSLYCCYRLLVM